MRARRSHSRCRRDEKVEEAVEGHGYTQREVADFLGLHFTSVSRIMKPRNKIKRK
jgi:transcriptional regulator with XRE-family HTH domain